MILTVSKDGNIDGNHVINPYQVNETYEYDGDICVQCEEPMCYDATYLMTFNFCDCSLDPCYSMVNLISKQQKNIDVEKILSL